MPVRPESRSDRHPTVAGQFMRRRPGDHRELVAKMIGLKIPPLFQKGKPVSEQKNALDEVISKLKQERDELKLQMHLASMEAKDEYDRVSGKVDQLTEQYEPVKDAVADSAENLFTALGMVADELKAGFKRVRKSISEQE